VARLIDRTGQRFGRLLVIERAADRPASPGHRARVAWLCRCECGTEVTALASTLTSQKSCGCQLREAIAERSARDITGQRFGALTVLRRGENYVLPSGKPVSRWLVRCDCGREKVVLRPSLVGGTTVSCGCQYTKGSTGVQYLYRAYSASGDLLYVGITNHVQRRLRQHAQEKPWWPEVDWVLEQILPDRRWVDHMETMAIRRQKPKYNKAKVA
jgi:hypothetical protein